MKQIKSNNENCISVVTSCVEWNGGTIEYLGICDGDSLNNLLWEVIAKLQEIAGEDLATFDIDSLLDICDQKAPLEVNLLNILTLIKDNQVCLKDFIDELENRLNELFKNTGVNVDLKCYAQFDNLGNPLSMTRDQLDQLVINILCDHKLRIESLEGNFILLKQQVDAIDPTATVEELSYAICLDPGVEKPTSTNVIELAQDHCDLQDATGTPADMSIAQGRFPSADIPVSVTTDPNWNLLIGNKAELDNNAYLLIQNLLTRVLSIEENCCRVNCDEIKLGFTALYSEDSTELDILFSWGAGTIIPAGFTDCGSAGTITDIDGQTIDFNIDILDGTTTVNIVGLNTLGELEVNINVKLCNGTLICQKCVSRKVAKAACQFCTYTASGTTGSAVIVYTINTLT